MNIDMRRDSLDSRHEIKLYVNTADCVQLRVRLRAIAKPDEHAVDDSGYDIRSLYFDNYSDKAVIDKLSGQSRREKSRLRYYNGDRSFIRLGRKSKDNKLWLQSSVGLIIATKRAMICISFTRHPCTICALCRFRDSRLSGEIAQVAE